MTIKLYDFQGNCAAEFNKVLRYVGYCIDGELFFDIYHNEELKQFDRHIHCSDYLNIEVIL